MAIQLSLSDLSLAQIVGYAFLSYCVYVSSHPLARCRLYVDIFSQYILSSIFCLYFHSLAQYPGPLLARVSVWPSFWHTLKGNRHIWLWQLQEIYGNIAFSVCPSNVAGEIDRIHASLRISCAEYCAPPMANVLLTVFRTRRPIPARCTPLPNPYRLPDNLRHQGQR